MLLLRLRLGAAAAAAVTPHLPWWLQQATDGPEPVLVPVPVPVIALRPRQHQLLLLCGVLQRWSLSAVQRMAAAAAAAVEAPSSILQAA